MLWKSPFWKLKKKFSAIFLSSPQSEQNPSIHTSITSRKYGTSNSLPAANVEPYHHCLIPEPRPPSVGSTSPLSNVSSLSNRRLLSSGHNDHRHRTIGLIPLDPPPFPYHNDSVFCPVITRKDHQAPKPKRLLPFSPQSSLL